MSPTFLAGDGRVLYWQDILRAAGGAAGALCFVVGLLTALRRKRFGARRVLFLAAAQAALLFPAFYGGRLIRGATYAARHFSLPQVLKGYAGEHFAGVVLVWAVLFPVAWYFLFGRGRGAAAAAEGAAEGAIEGAIEGAPARGSRRARRAAQAEAAKAAEAQARSPRLQAFLQDSSFAGLYFSAQHLFNRVGCLLSGCCYGRPYSGLFSIRFPEGSEPADQLAGGAAVSVFPTQPLEAGASLALLAACFWLIAGKQGRRMAMAWPAFLAGFGAAVFASEAMMAPGGGAAPLGLTFPQWAALAMMAAGACLARAAAAEGKARPDRGRARREEAGDMFWSLRWELNKVRRWL